jgi:hypothetical protein
MIDSPHPAHVAVVPVFVDVVDVVYHVTTAIALGTLATCGFARPDSRQLITHWTWNQFNFRLKASPMDELWTVILFAEQCHLLNRHPSPSPFQSPIRTSRSLDPRGKCGV